MTPWGGLNSMRTGRSGDNDEGGKGKQVLVHKYLSPQVVIQLFNGVQCLTELVREVYLFTLHYLSTSLDHVLHFRLQFAHCLVVFLRQHKTHVIHCLVVFLRQHKTQIIYCLVVFLGQHKTHIIHCLVVFLGQHKTQIIHCLVAFLGQHKHKSWT